MLKAVGERPSRGEVRVIVEGPEDIVLGFFQEANRRPASISYPETYYKVWRPPKRDQSLRRLERFCMMTYSMCEGLDFHCLLDQALCTTGKRSNMMVDNADNE